MAQQPGVTDALAAYGAAQHQQAYALLRKVSHWPQTDVVREKRQLGDPAIVPTYRLDRFDQLLDRIEFTAFALATTYPEIRLTKAIGDESPIKAGTWQIPIVASCPRN